MAPLLQKSHSFSLQADLKRALDLGVVINLDNEYEMEIVDELIKAQGLSCPLNKGRVQVIGLRINPAFEQVLHVSIKLFDNILKEVSQLVIN